MTRRTLSPELPSINVTWWSCTLSTIPMCVLVLAFCGPKILAFLARYERPVIIASIAALILAIVVFHFR